jgi:hypothetical protein
MWRAAVSIVVLWVILDSNDFYNPTGRSLISRDEITDAERISKNAETETESETSILNLLSWFLGLE